MYSTCLFCNTALGRNESIEAFPVGRRIAFDAAKGRLWVVCPKCARWNLSPFESRWEAIEEAERAYRDTRVRVATDHIGLAKLGEGLELVRIGQPLLPEFAAWRYGGIFKRRFNRERVLALGVGLGGSATGLTIFGGGAAVSLGLTAIAFASLGFDLARKAHRARVPRLTIRTDDGRHVRLSAWDASLSKLDVSNNEPWSLQLVHRHVDAHVSRAGRLGGVMSTRAEKPMVLHGDAARRALATMLPTVNHHGGDKREITAATEFAVAYPEVGDAFTMPLKAILATSNVGKAPQGPLGRLHATHRLGLEMLLHEADERRALEGELRELEQRWHEAEMIAAIADGLLLPAALDERMRELRSLRDQSSAQASEHRSEHRSEHTSGQ